ncbi:hypothetical protein [Bradyrhizobium sp. Tv2a-2]|uniref:hypothetical protein n=1 Tax=Bradyrhizobium sp. Tv2a-2 TaxID=113395 RepID=UPI00041B9733|nr:hypothetical protein [Bradyrhizobium sp. Tv2a-2]
MEHGDTVAGETSQQQDRALAGGALADRRPVRCGAMMQQDCSLGLQSTPQQFIRLVGGYHRPAPARNQALTG